MDSLQRQFRELLISAPDATLVVSEIGEIVYANHQIEPLLGWTAQELKNQPVDLLVPEMAVEKHRGYMTHFFKHPHVRPLGTHTELMARKKDGGLLNVSISLSPVQIDGLFYAITAIRDIARLKKLESNLRLSQEFNLALLNSFPFAVALLDVDANIIRVNDRWSSFALDNGWHKNFAAGVGLNYLEITRPPEGIFTNGDVELTGGIQAVLKRDCERFEGVYQCRYSRQERWYRITVVPLHDDFEGALVNHIDITAQIQAERFSSDTTDRLNNIIDTAPFGAHLYLLDDQDGLVFNGHNRAADDIIQIDHKAAAGKAIEEIFPSLKGSPHLETLRQVARGAEALQREQIVFHNESQKFIFEISASQIESEQLVIFFHDLTEAFQSYEATLEGWSLAMDLRDQDTAGHTKRTAQLATRVGAAMGLDEVEQLYLRWGALVHDIGKMAVPDYILNKKGELSREEWDWIRKHPDFARQMLKPIRFLRSAIEIPYCHHEKWDGSGYPQGLKGEAIPLAARIFAVVDVWDALNSDRPYRRAWPCEKALAYIKDNAGSHFDPAVVEAFVNLYECGEI